MKKNKKAHIITWSIALAIIVGGVGAGNAVALQWDGALSRLMGTIGATTLPTETEEFSTGFENDEALVKAQKEFTEKVASESVVLLKNSNNTLPMKGNEKISLFGLSSKGIVTVGSGSGSSALDENCTWENSFKQAGFEVNKTLLDFYRKSSHKHGTGSSQKDWSIDEVPLSEYTQEVKASYASYKDAAIMVVGRTGGEGGDLARDMSSHKGTADRNYLSLSKEEDELLKSLKSNGFSKVILVVNSAYPMELGQVDQEAYGVDACVWVGNTGVNGLDAVGKVFKGEYNPSGRTVDTYWYDNMSIPAMQNMGDLDLLNLDGSDANIKYVAYSEGIYVGYRYPETRYADQVMGNQNIGNFDYSKTVKYPFGYGLSYSTFEWSNYTISSPDADGIITASIDVKNTSSTYAGKDVVEIYAQSPYTDYDKENGIEKSAVDLVGFTKTDVLKPGESKTYEIKIDLKDCYSYATNIDNGTYILEEGNYYFAAGRNAHNALNNILAAQDFNIIGEDSDLNKDLVQVNHQNETVKNKVAPTGAEIKNKFDDADLNYYMPNTMKHLTRSNWAMMDNNGLRLGEIDSKGRQVLKVNQKVIDAYNLSGYEASGAPALNTRKDKTFTYEAKNDLELVDLKGLDYNDPKWDLLLDELKYSEQTSLFGKAGYGTDEIKSINKPKTFEYDGPASISNFITGEHCFSFPSETTMAATWNVELLKEFGTLAGCDAIKSKTSGWYAPGANTHRTPFDGRNFEYFSEDAFLSGTMVAQEISGAQEKGVYVYVKHFALNDQETNRQDICTFANEQTIREVYLKNFEFAVIKGGTKGVMTAFNRIGTRNAEGHYNLITGVLREEWGFVGAVITDYKATLTPQKTDQFLAAGNDEILSTVKNQASSKDPWVRNEIRRAAKNVLYVQANSLAMNGLSHGATYSAGFAVYKLLLIILDVVVLAGASIKVFDLIKKGRMSQEQFEAIPPMTKKQKIIMWSIIGVAVVALTIVFFTVLLPLILKATGAVI